MSASDEIKQTIAETFYNQLRDGRSVLDYGFNEREKPLPIVGGWPIGPSGFAFKEFNALQLMTVAIERGFTSPVFFKTQQIKNNGYYIAKGEAKATKVESSYKQDDGEIKTVMVPCFNADQVKNVPSHAHTYAWQEAGQTCEEFLDALIANTGAKFHFDPLHAPFYARESDTIYMAPREHYGAKHPNGVDQFYNDALFVLTDWATHPSRYQGVQPGEAGSERDSQYRLGRQLALLQIASRIGLRFEPDATGWQSNYVTARPHWRELERAGKAAEQIIKTIGVPELVQARVPSKIWQQEQTGNGFERKADVAPGQEKDSPTFADHIHVVHVADKPSKDLEKAIKDGLVNGSKGAKGKRKEQQMVQ